jgi:hypothetical protein
MLDHDAFERNRSGSENSVGQTAGLRYWDSDNFAHGTTRSPAAGQLPVIRGRRHRPKPLLVTDAPARLRVVRTAPV